MKDKLQQAKDKVMAALRAAEGTESKAVIRQLEKIGGMLESLQAKVKS